MKVLVTLILDVKYYHSYDEQFDHCVRKAIKELEGPVHDSNSEYLCDIDVEGAVINRIIESEEL